MLAAAYAAPAAFAQPMHAQNLPAATDLAADAARAVAARRPILLFFNRGDCPYCERALAQFLVPMTRDDAWRERAVYRQVETDRALAVVDFDGRPTTHRDLAARYGVHFTPTIIVVDGGGVPIGDPLVGLTTPDFYAALVERAIEAGERDLRQ